jgi:putative tryptophan/tyrosine transport system substrate-binding protein
MNRRTALLALATAPLWPIIAHADESLPIVGMLITHPPVTDPVVQALREGLTQHGYEHGKNIRFEVRTALGDLDKVPALAAEFVRMKASVVVLANEPALRAVVTASRTIPIVFTGYLEDPIAAGWIKSYRKPGGNVTGAFTANSELVGKRLELIKEVLPRAAKLAVMWHPEFGQRQVEEVQRLSPNFGLQTQVIQVLARDDFKPAFNRAKSAGADAALLVWSPVFYVNRTLAAEEALAVRLPVFSDINKLTDAGTLLSYGSFGNTSFTNAARYVDRILKGAKPGDLAVEQMSNIKLVVNAKTAKALGVSLPKSILARADEVIR